MSHGKPWEATERGRETEEVTDQGSQVDYPGVYHHQSRQPRPVNHSPLSAAPPALDPVPCVSLLRPDMELLLAGWRRRRRQVDSLRGQGWVGLRCGGACVTLSELASLYLAFGPVARVSAMLLHARDLKAQAERTSVAATATANTTVCASCPRQSGTQPTTAVCSSLA